MSLLNKSKRIPLLCYVTDRRSLSSAALSGSGGSTPPHVERSPAGEDRSQWHDLLLDRIRNAAEAGVDWIQIREKDLSGRECSRLTSEAQQSVGKACAEKPQRPRVLVNDRLDVALAVHTDGVHLGEKSLPPHEAKRLREALHRQDFLIGVSCHSLEAAKSAERGGADYIFFGPVFATPSKASYGAPQGLERLSEVCRAVSIPVLAIGGITLNNFASCLSAGAAGIAAIRLFQDAPDMAAVIRALREIAC